MRVSFIVACTCVLVLLARHSFADFTGAGHVHTHSETKQIFLNPQCAANDTCDLKRFTLTTSVDEIWFSDDPNYPTYRNGVIMEYETESVNALEKYAIVQFIKGCVFYSSRNRDGSLTRSMGLLVPSFGEDVPLCFPKWVIDSQDTDPVYNSDPDYGRFYLLRWNKPGSYDHQQQKYYGAEKPKRPVVYMTDYPAGAFVTESGVKNASLKFKTCIYKAKDVPRETRRDDTEFATPLTCFEWQNIYVYDFAKGQFHTRWMDVPAPEETHMLVGVYLLLILVILLTSLALLNFSGLKLISQPKRSLLLGFCSAVTACVLLIPANFHGITIWLSIVVVAANVLTGALIGISTLSKAGITRGTDAARAQSTA